MRDLDNDAGLNNALVADGLIRMKQSRVHLHHLVSGLAVNDSKGFLHIGQLGGLLVII